MMASRGVPDGGRAVSAVANNRQGLLNGKTARQNRRFFVSSKSKIECGVQ